jgi:hypothetical protein
MPERARIACDATQTTKAEENAAAKVTGTITSLRTGGATLQAIADELNNMGVATPRASSDAYGG